PDAASTLFPCLLFCHDPPTSEIYTLSLHDALPILRHARSVRVEGAHRRHQFCQLFIGLFNFIRVGTVTGITQHPQRYVEHLAHRSEEHTSELQSRENLVCRLLLEKKKKLTIA